jgi:glycosyltransferase involved in cell wall biosynthesis
LLSQKKSHFNVNRGNDFESQHLMKRTNSIANLPDRRDHLTLPDNRILHERIARSHKARPMRVLVVLDGRHDRELDPTMVDIANRMHVRRHEVITVIAGRTGAFPSTQDFLVPPLPDLRTNSSVGLVRKLVKLITEYQPSMIIAGSHFTRHPALVAAESSKRRPRVVLYKNEGLSEMALSARFNASLVLPMADLVVATSETAKEDILHYSSDMRIKTHSIYAPHIGPDLKFRSRVAVEHPWFVNPTAPIFIMHETITGSKNQINVIDRIAELARPMPTRLMMFGKGSGRRALQRRIDKLDIPHLVTIQDPVDDVSPFIARANGFLRADPSTSIPRSMVEAINLGCPVIAFAHDDAIHEALPTSDCGRRIDRNSLEEFTMAMKEAITTMHRNSSPSVKRFEHDHIIDEHVNACLSVRFLKRKKAPPRLGFAESARQTLALPGS